MNDEKFKVLRHRFWRLGKERRLGIIKKMGFQVISLGAKQAEGSNSLSGATLLRYSFNVMIFGVFGFSTEYLLSKEKNEPSPEDVLMAEKTQREILYFISNHDLVDEIIALIEEQEALITAEEEGAAYLKQPRPTEFPPSKEELEAMKYVPGTKREV